MLVWLWHGLLPLHKLMLEEPCHLVYTESVTIFKPSSTWRPRERTWREPQQGLISGPSQLLGSNHNNQARRVGNEVPGNLCNCVECRKGPTIAAGVALYWASARAFISEWSTEQCSSYILLRALSLSNTSQNTGLRKALELSGAFLVMRGSLG